MDTALVLLVVLLLLGWGGGLAFGASNIIHVLLILILAIVLVRALSGSRVP